MRAVAAQAALREAQAEAAAARQEVQWLSAQLGAGGGAAAEGPASDEVPITQRRALIAQVPD